MTTPSPDTPVEEETLEQIAERITRRWGSQYRTQLANAITEALRNERERCAKVADKRARELRLMAREPLLRPEIVNRFKDQSNECEGLARAIRKGR